MNNNTGTSKQTDTYQQEILEKYTQDMTKNNIPISENYKPLTKNQIELLKQITDVKQELGFRKNSLHNNIFAGVHPRSILASKSTILDLEIKLQHLNHKYEFNLP